MELAQPAGVTDVRLPARNVLGIAGIDEDQLEPMLFESHFGWSGTASGSGLSRLKRFFGLIRRFSARSQ